MSKIIFCTIFFFISVTQSSLECKADSVTYPGIGTFTDHDFYDPEWRPLVFLPESPEKIHPLFKLFNRKNQYTPEELRYNEKSSAFNPQLQTKILVHGLLDDDVFLGDWMEKMKDHFLVIRDYNVIIVDWSNGNGLPYTQAVANTRVVGPMIAIFIEKLCETFNVQPDSFHILGHSLGAHVAGYAGKFLNGTLGHITGFDPAGPYYEGLKESAARLWHTDAMFVESIHTDARHLIPDLGFGMYDTCSHVDFYPNGGRSQPGCDQERIDSIIIKGLLEGARRLVACNHQRSVDFYLESLSDLEASPVAYQCEDYESFQNGECTSCGSDGSKCAVIGLASEDYKKFIKDRSVSQGKRWFMSTAPHPKFFRFQYMITLNMGPSSGGHQSQQGKITLKMVDWEEKGYEFDFIDGEQTYNYDTSYSRVIVTDMDPKELETIHFKWTYGFNIIPRTMSIDSIEVVPLASKTGVPTTRTHSTFSADSQEIPNNHEVIFRKSF